MTDSPPVELADFDALLELLDQHTMRDVIRLFVTSAPERLRVANDGIAAGEQAVVATAFHTMRSGCGQLGARHLEQLCANAERAAKHGDLSAAAAGLAEVRVEYERCLAWFRERGWLSS